MSVEQQIKNNARKAGTALRKTFDSYMKDNVGQSELLDAVQAHENAQAKILKFEELVKDMDTSNADN